MHFTRSLLLAAFLATSASFATTLPAAADSATAARADLLVHVRHGDRDRYRDRDHRRSDHRWRKQQRRCYTNVDYRHRFGHRVRVIERICFRNGRKYVASRRIVRVGRYR